MHFLDQVQLAFTCPLRWEKLQGTGDKRFCGQCDKQVTNLSAMTRSQAEAWLYAHQDVPVCVRVEVGGDGRAVHRPAVRLLGAAALGLAAACASDEDTGFEQAMSAPVALSERVAHHRASAENAATEVRAMPAGIPELGGGDAALIGQVAAEPPTEPSNPPVEIHPVLGRMPARTVERMGEPPAVVMGGIRAPIRGE